MNATLKLVMAVFAAIVLSACASNSSRDSSTSGGQGQGEDVSDPGASTVIVDDNGGTSDSGFSSANANLETVFYFDFDQSSLNFDTRAALNAWAASLSANPRSVRLEGHADERGTREYNIALGERRAKAIADYLTSSGVASGLIETISYGEERPAVPGTGESAWSQNRRVELK